MLQNWACLGTTFITKLAQNVCDFWLFLETNHLLSKNCCGYFLVKLSYFVSLTSSNTGSMLLTIRVVLEYNQRILTVGGSITVRLTSCLTRQISCCLLNISKAAESKQNKQEVSCTVILNLKLVFFDISHKLRLKSQRKAQGGSRQKNLNIKYFANI